MKQELNSLEQAYARGFAAKCAEYGVNPVDVRKQLTAGPRIGGQKTMSALLGSAGDVREDMIAGPRVGGLKTMSYRSPGAQSSGLVQALKNLIKSLV
jgi:hypothetical protein